MDLLPGVSSPSDLRSIPASQLPDLAEEIRDFLVKKVSKTGGHLGPNLGVVELTIALHRVFDSPREPLIFDVGHQTYVHKILTGRQAGFDKLRTRGGISGYASRSESVHDWSESSHASASLSYVDGLSKAFEVEGDPRPVVGIIGDGALTGGMAWEALNNIAAGGRPVVIVVNDNGRSYSPTIGGLATRLAALRLKPRYEKTLGRFRSAISSAPVVGPVLYDALHGIKVGIKDMVSPQGMFSDLGMKYVGPVDGHDVTAVENALRLAKDFGGPVIVHCVTRKGYGYAPAENHEEDQFHSLAAFDSETGKSLSGAKTTWTDVFADEISSIGEDRDDVVVVTAAMLHPTGLAEFGRRFPKRTFDVGIAEQHALTSAAGLAMGGLHPVVAIYSTFLNRAVDQFIMDIALHQTGVTLCLDRAGITGNDGPSHNGVWDLALLSGVPGVRIAAPRDGQTLRRELRTAVDVNDAPTVLRWSKGSDLSEIPAVGGTDAYDVLVAGERKDVVIVTVGPMAAKGIEVANLLAERGIGATVVDPGWVIPVAAELVDFVTGFGLVVTVEDGLRQGGVGSAISQAVRDTGSLTPTRELGVPSVFPQYGSRDEVLRDCGLSVGLMTEDIASWYARIHGPHEVSPLRNNTQI